MGRGVFTDCKGVVMAAQGSRTLKLSLLADVAEFTKGIKTASKDTESIGDQFTAFGKKAAVAFAAAGAAIGAFAIASVKAAAEDEVGQKKLEETIRNTTSATADQIAGIDKYITKQSIATNTTDDVLRPALSRLVLATKDVTKAQELLSLAQEIAAARSLPLETVTNALGKAYEGSNTALGKLGTGISKATLATLTFDETQQLLNKTFDGFIENQADTAAFKFGQIKIAVDESKEAIGAALLPVVKELADFLIVTVVPAIESFVAGLTGDDGLKDGLTDSQVTAIEWGKKVRGVIDTVINLKDELIALAAVIGTVFIVSKISAAVVATIALINTLIKAYNLLKASAIVAGVATAFALNPLLGVGAVALAAGVLAGANALARSGDTPGAETFAVGGAPGAISGGSRSTGSTTVSGGGGTGGGGGGVATAVKTAAIATKAITGAFTDSQNAARLTAQGGGGFTDSQNAARLAAQGGITINVNAPSIIDEEAFSRATTNALNNSTFRGTNGASNLVFL
jgi:hypothetical protein